MSLLYKSSTETDRPSRTEIGIQREKEVQKLTSVHRGGGHLFHHCRHFLRRGYRILKWGANFCDNVIQPKPG